MKKPREKVREHEEPSAASLREMPEVDFSKGTWRRNRLAARIAREGATFPGGYIPPRRGRPKKGEEPGPSLPRSVRFPMPIEAALKKKAKAQGLTVHAAIRTAVVEWLGGGGFGSSR